MLRISETLQHQFELCAWLVLALTLNVAGGEVVAGRIAVLVGGVHVPILEHEIHRGQTARLREIGLRGEERDFMVVATIQGLLLDGFELPDVEVRAGNGVLSHAEFSLQREARRVLCGIRLVDGAIVAQTPRNNLVADDVHQCLFKYGELVLLTLRLINNRAQMSSLEGLHAKHVLCCRGFGADYERHHADDLAGSILHRAKEQASIDLMATLRFVQKLRWSF